MPAPAKQCGYGGYVFLNFLWPIAFFSAHQIELAFAIIILLLTSIVGFMASAWTSDRMAALLFGPYAAWVTFAAVLNGYIVAANQVCTLRGSEQLSGVSRSGSASEPRAAQQIKPLSPLFMGL